ncbi:hypothetical protein GQ600_18780 [Phytophthora cactorum]|nr:hypothetical protein GQ600_18780 [Phytophthora cactorum]
MTSATGPTRSISGSFRFDVDPAALHEVCEQTGGNTAQAHSAVANMVTAASALHGAPQIQTLSTTVTENAQVVVVVWYAPKSPPMEAVVVQAMAACTARAPSAVVNTATAEWGHHGATTTPIPSTMEEAAPSVLRVLQYYSKLYE